MIFRYKFFLLIYILYVWPTKPNELTVCSFFLIYIYLFIYFWLRWVFVAARRLSF